MLKKTKVDARGVVIKELSKRAFVDKLSDLSHSAGKEERVVHHNPELLTFGQFDQPLRLFSCGSERLLDKYMLAISECSLGEFEMSPDRSDNGNRVDIWRCQHGFYIRSYFDAREVDAGSLQSRRIFVANRHNLAVLRNVEVSDDTGTPVPIADH